MKKDSTSPRVVNARTKRTQRFLSEIEMGDTRTKAALETLWRGLGGIANGTGTEDGQDTLRAVQGFALLHSPDLSSAEMPLISGSQNDELMNFC